MAKQFDKCDKWKAEQLFVLIKLIFVLTFILFALMFSCVNIQFSVNSYTLVMEWVSLSFGVVCSFLCM